MRKTFGLVVVWLVVTGAGIVLTSGAVRDVRGSVTDTVASAFYLDPPDGTGAADPILASTTSGDLVLGIGDAETGPELRPTSEPTVVDVATASEGTSTPSATVPVTAAPVKASTTSTTTGTTTTSTSTTTTAAPSTVKTYQSLGGSVTVEIGDGTLTLLGAVPNSGFVATEEDRGDPTKVTVEFKSADHHSSIEVKFDSGKVVSEIEEEPQG